LAVRLLGGIELLIDDDAVLEVVDAQIRGLAEAHGTQMASDFDSAGVSSFDRSAEFCSGYVHVGFKRSGAFIDPVIHRSRCVIRVL
jgi:hypothetical protein